MALSKKISDSVGKNIMAGSNQIAVIGCGSILPGSRNCAEFWKTLCEGEPQFSILEPSRAPNTSESIRSNVGVVNNDWLIEFSKKRNLPLPRIYLMAMHALEECLDSLAQQLNGKEVYLSLGCMDQDEAAAKKCVVDVLRQKENPHDQALVEKLSSEIGDPNLVTSLQPLMHKLREMVGIPGSGLVVDAACASSLAALDCAIDQLRLKNCDIAVVGGLESTLSSETFVPFEKLGVLCSDKCMPFDVRSDGLSQGEGAVFFVLQRLADAKRDNQNVVGVIDGIVSSSNGNRAGCFAPSETAQSELVSRANKYFGTEGVRYIEAHGTGTRIGDVAELNALKQSFVDPSKSVLVGSSKAIFGHTKGAAGAVGLLKALMVVRNRYVPPSPYCVEPLFESENLRVNTQGVEITDKWFSVRVSSTGFGGANYHVQVSSEKEGLSPELKAIEICEMAEGSSSLERLAWEFDYYELKVPPKVRSQIDPFQKAALLTTCETIERSFIDLSSFASEHISVISSGPLGLPSMRELVLQTYLGETAMDEQCAGTLNSLIGGRISQALNFRGKNFHIDLAGGDKKVVLDVIQAQISLEPKSMVIWIDTDLENEKIGCHLFISPELAHKSEWNGSTQN